MADKLKVTKAKLADLIPDDRNLNKGTERGKELIAKSLNKFGAVRGIAVDKDNRIIAGNKTVENAIEQGIEDVIRTWLHPEKMNPLGRWTGGTNVDAGATNRKLGSDMGDAVTGGGLHGKDLSKADVSVNVYLWAQAQKTGRNYKAYCTIGSDEVIIYEDGKLMPHAVKYADIVNEAREIIDTFGGFERLAEWGLI